MRGGNDFLMMFSALGRVRGGVAPLANPSFVLVGDSLTAFGQFSSPSLSAKTLTRDAAGLISAAVTSHGIIGQPLIYFANCNDGTYERFGQAVIPDANTINLQTGDTGAAGSTTGTTNGAILVQNRFSQRGDWLWLQSLSKGALRFLGNFGQGGDEPQDMAGALTRALARNPDIVRLAGGINSIYAGNRTVANAYAQITPLIDQIKAAGKRALVYAVTPVSSSYSAYSTAKNANAISLNALVAAYCAQTPNQTLFVDCHTPLYDPPNQCALSWVTNDTLHWTTRAALVIAQAASTAMATAGWITLDASMLPVSAGDTSVINSFAKLTNAGPWSAATGGTASTGMTGVAPPGYFIQRAAGTGTGVLSIEDGGDGLGYWSRCDYTSAGATDSFNVYPEGNANKTLATLGVSATDTLAYGLEVAISGAQAANLKALSLVLGGNGANGQAFAGTTSVNDGGAGFPDTFQCSLLTGLLLPNPAVASFSINLGLVFSAAGSPLTVKVRRGAYYKLNGGQQ